MCPLPLEPPTIPDSSHPFKLSQSTRLSSLCYTATFSILYVVIYMFQCYLLNLSHPLLPPPSLVAQRVKRLPTMRETWVQSLGQEDLLEKEMAPHSSILPGKSMDGGVWWVTLHGVAKSRTWLSDFTFTFLSLFLTSVYYPWHLMILSHESSSLGFCHPKFTNTKIILPLYPNISEMLYIFYLPEKSWKYLGVYCNCLKLWLGTEVGRSTAPNNNELTQISTF